MDIRKFAFVDIAFLAAGSKSLITPLNIAIVSSSGGYCGLIANLQPGTYLPVLHAADWESAEPRQLSKGEKVSRIFFPLRSLEKLTCSQGCFVALCCVVSHLSDQLPAILLHHVLQERGFLHLGYYFAVLAAYPYCNRKHSCVVIYFLR